MRKFNHLKFLNRRRRRRHRLATTRFDWVDVNNIFYENILAKLSVSADVN